MSAIAETQIEADPNVPIIRITREFAGTPGQLLDVAVEELYADGLRVTPA